MCGAPSLLNHSLVNRHTIQVRDRYLVFVNTQQKGEIQVISFSINKSMTIEKESLLLQNAQKAKTDIEREYLGLAYENAVDGRINDELNLGGYGTVCRNNEMKTRTKDLALFTTEEVNEGVRYGVAESIAFTVDTEIDDILESSVATQLVAEFLEMQELIYLDKGVNVLRVIQLARDGYKNMQNTLKVLVAQYPGFDGLLESVLRNPNCVLELESAMV